MYLVKLARLPCKCLSTKSQDSPKTNVVDQDVAGIRPSYQDVARPGLDG